MGLDGNDLFKEDCIMVWDVLTFLNGGVVENLKLGAELASRLNEMGVKQDHTRTSDRSKIKWIETTLETLKGSAMQFASLSFLAATVEMVKLSLNQLGELMCVLGKEQALLGAKFQGIGDVPLGIGSDNQTRYELASLMLWVKNMENKLLFGAQHAPVSGGAEGKQAQI